VMTMRWRHRVVSIRFRFTQGEEMIKTLVKVAAAAAVTAAAIGAHAQPATTGAPAAVGVSPGTAADAASKAVPRSDTGTLVRTAPNPSDRAAAAVDGTRAGMGGSTAATTSPTAGSTAPMSAPVQRARKADRN
jgi:hypothetical protein